MKRFFVWLSSSFSGNDNKSSSRKLTAFGVVILYYICSIWFFLKASNEYYMMLVIFGQAVFICLLFGIVTMQQIIQFKSCSIIDLKDNSEEEVKKKE
ncbi:hypothetical protein [Xanthocytophaga agilis]|uniref:Uncharacterized protein n=1 Tax=Xanthocytophaga agilis TaxID=3048010 RepID=A0AAE3UCZ1_9BACT|nr:hypothetical protein [Xanthocytophaga agilis]MDJ1500640.1 hypothetical protein [Xanthocytophaga agilis]